MSHRIVLYLLCAIVLISESVRWRVMEERPIPAWNATLVLKDRTSLHNIVLPFVTKVVIEGKYVDVVGNYFGGGLAIGDGTNNMQISYNSFQLQNADEYERLKNSLKGSETDDSLKLNEPSIIPFKN